jgi:hypothetical protein
VYGAQPEAIIPPASRPVARRTAAAILRLREICAIKADQRK